MVQLMFFMVQYMVYKLFVEHGLKYWPIILKYLKVIQNDLINDWYMIIMSMNVIGYF